MATTSILSVKSEPEFASRTEPVTIRPSEYADIVKRLHSAGARFVLCNDGKHPIWQRWQMRRPSVRAILQHMQDKRLVGIIPATVMASVVDVDSVDAIDDLVRLAHACSARSVVPSRRPGGYHIYVPDDLLIDDN